MYIGNLHFKMGEDELRKLFEEYGEVASVKVINDKQTGRSKGYGFVDMPDASEAAAAMAELNEKEVLGRKLRVTEALERKEGERTERKFSPQNKNGISGYAGNNTSKGNKDEY